jgi:hypothetical protein
MKKTGQFLDDGRVCLYPVGFQCSEGNTLAKLGKPH